MAQAAALASARDKKFAEWFDGRRWRVAAELDGAYVAIGYDRVVPAAEANGADGVRVLFDHGRFEIEKPGIFQTPLGHKGRAGYVLIEVGADGADLPEQPAAPCFGQATLEHALSAYGGIVGLPEQAA